MDAGPFRCPDRIRGHGKARQGFIAELAGGPSSVQSKRARRATSEHAAATIRPSYSNAKVLDFSNFFKIVDLP
jgi:hypothetical protein